MATIYRCDRCGAESKAEDALDWANTDQGEIICESCQNPELAGTIPISISLPCPRCKMQGSINVRIQNPELGPDSRLAHFICENEICGKTWALILEMKPQ